MKYLISIAICICFLFSCKDKITVLDTAKMQDVMWDIIQLGAYSQLVVAPDTIKMSAKKNILLQQKIL